MFPCIRQHAAPEAQRLGPPCATRQGPPRGPPEQAPRRDRGAACRGRVPRGASAAVRGPVGLVGEARARRGPSRGCQSAAPHRRGAGEDAPGEGTGVAASSRRSLRRCLFDAAALDRGHDVGAVHARGLAEAKDRQRVAAATAPPGRGGPPCRIPSDVQASAAAYDDEHRPSAHLEGPASDPRRLAVPRLVLAQRPDPCRVSDDHRASLPFERVFAVVGDLPDPHRLARGCGARRRGGGRGGRRVRRPPRLPGLVRRRRGAPGRAQGRKVCGLALHRPRHLPWAGEGSAALAEADGAVPDGLARRPQPSAACRCCKPHQQAVET
mmetsp:Transcript_23330/g.79016  ORF Transcript_23330/g.79016 Transcript_23330/m.79016 type:complete len:324 (-) Transcript_23330:1622-2593(-)